MTPKEKAKELVDIYDKTLTYIESKNKSKECALITVDEIINVCNVLEHWLGLEYWYNVKQEIEKL